MTPEQYWQKRCEAAEKYVASLRAECIQRMFGQKPFTQDNQRNIETAWLEIVNSEPIPTVEKDWPTGKIIQALEIAYNAPELNMGNYDDEQVRELNNAMIELCQLLRDIVNAGSNN